MFSVLTDMLGSFENSLRGGDIPRTPKKKQLHKACSGEAHGNGVLKDKKGVLLPTCKRNCLLDHSNISLRTLSDADSGQESLLLPLSPRSSKIFLGVVVDGNRRGSNDYCDSNYSNAASPPQHVFSRGPHQNILY